MDHSAAEHAAGDDLHRCGIAVRLCRRREDMDGYTLGREIVDAFHAFYSQTGEEWTGFKATPAVVDTHNYMTRMLPLLKEMTGILQSEAFDQGAVNGKYNFYDELIVSSGSLADRFV